MLAVLLHQLPVDERVLGGHLAGGVPSGAGADAAGLDDGHPHTAALYEQRGCEAGNAATDDCHVDDEVSVEPWVRSLVEAGEPDR